MSSPSPKSPKARPVVNCLAVDEKVAARALDHSVHFLRKDRRQPQPVFPYFKIGKSVRYNLQRLEATLAALEKGGTAVRGKKRRVAP
jgi:hypothetical protein